MPHVQVLWPDGRPTGRLLRTEDARVVAQAVKGDRGEESMLQLADEEASSWVMLRRQADSAVVGEDVRDDLVDAGLVAKLLLTPQAVVWFADQELPVPPELRAAATRAVAAFKLVKSDADLQRRFDQAKREGLDVSEPLFRPAETQALRDLGLVFKVTIDGSPHLRVLGLARPHEPSGLLTWIAPAVKAASRLLRIPQAEAGPAPVRRTRPTNAEFAQRLALAKDLATKNPEWSIKRLAQESRASERSLKKPKFRTWLQLVREAHGGSRASKMRAPKKSSGED